MAASRRRSLRRSRRALWLALLVLPLLAYLASGLLAPQRLLQAALRLVLVSLAQTPPTAQLAAVVQTAVALG